MIIRRLYRHAFLVFALAAWASPGRGDIFQWEYINPANPNLGKQQSTTLCPDGAGAVVGIATDLYNRNLTKAYLSGANLSSDWSSCGDDGCFYILSDLTGANLTQADLTGANLFSAVLDGANLTDAEVRGANFYREVSFAGYGGLTLAQLYSTASYKAHDLSGICLGNNLLMGGDLSGQILSQAHFVGAGLADANLTAADATGADFTFADLSRADTRGATFYLTKLINYAITTNLIQTNGHIAGLDLTAGGSLVVRDYDGNPAARPPTGPLPIVVDDHFRMNLFSSLKLVFEQDAWGSTISFAPGISVVRGGTLELAFAPGVDVAAQIGRTFEVFNWNGVIPTGSFTVASPYTWNLANLYTTGEVTLTSLSAIAGDFNHDGDVDGRDFLAWQRNPSIGDLADWQAGYGTSSIESVAVPEPSAILLLGVGVIAVMGRPNWGWDRVCHTDQLESCHRDSRPQG